eukprot:12681864-Alexandrium_andersonii.AAC.1
MVLFWSWCKHLRARHRLSSLSCFGNVFRCQHYWWTPCLDSTCHVIVAAVAVRWPTTTSSRGLREQGGWLREW